jgi:hypothetical protein
MTVYVALAITSAIAIGMGLWALHEAKKYRAYMDAQRPSKRWHRRHRRT